jgi:outer membrane protein assembly factor BamB
MHRYSWPLAVLIASAVMLVASAAGQAAAAPSLAWSPTTSSGNYDFGLVNIGDKPSQTFTLKNSGGAATSALTITLTGSAAFKKTADTCTATSLGPNKMCSVTVQYAPTTGNGDSATLTAASKKPAATTSIRLTGSGAVDWPMFRNTLSHEGWNTSEHILSTTSVGGLEQRWAAGTGGAVRSSPAVANGVVYVGSDDERVYALNATTGAVEWATGTGLLGNPGGVVRSSPAVANGVVYVGSDDDNVYALNATTGAVEWATRTGGAVRSSPAVANGVVYVGSDDEKVYALNATTGAVEWSTSSGGAVRSSPAVANGAIYVGSDDNKVYAFGLAS